MKSLLFLHSIKAFLNDGSERAVLRKWRGTGRELEMLEGRLLLSVVIAANGKSAKYFDVDGDKVTVSVSGGTLTAGNFTTVALGLGDQLQEINVSGGGFDGKDLTITVSHVAGGDGVANIGYINSTGHDLGNLTIKGDLGRIDVGDGVAATPAIKKLSVRSMGREGLVTQGGVGTLVSNVKGTLTALNVSNDLENARVNVTDSGLTPDGNIGSITIGGSLIGESGDDSGSIVSAHNIGAIKIGQDLQGGSGDRSGSIQAAGSITSLTIGGSMIGGGGVSSGMVETGSVGAGRELKPALLVVPALVAVPSSIGAVKIGGDLIGGQGLNSGEIKVLGNFASLTIGGSIIGGDGGDSARVSVIGSMGAVKVGGDMRGGKGDASGEIAVNGNVTSMTVGGSVTGGTGNTSAQALVGQNMGAVKIGHELQGGNGSSSGALIIGGKLASLTLGGSLLGGAGASSGEVDVTLDVGAIKVGGDFAGGFANEAGCISAGGNVTSVSIGRSVLGGSVSGSGMIESVGNIGTITIGKNIAGGSVGGTDSLDQSGYIESGGAIASVTVGGSIITGVNSGTGTLTKNASIRAGNSIGSLTVKGSLIGNRYAGVAEPINLTPVIISVRGQAVHGATTDVAIGSINIGKRVEFASILGGYDAGLTPRNADAQIGTVKVGGDWAASNLVAGASNTVSGNLMFGDGNDAKISGIGTTDTPAIISKITSVTVGGMVFGTPASEIADDHFGIVAEQVTTLKVGGFAVTLHPLAHNDHVNVSVGTTGDMTLVEI